MAKRRVYDIAKEKGLTSQELLERLKTAGLEVKSSVSTVEEADVDRVLATKAKPAAAKPASAKSATPKAGLTKPAATKVASAKPAAAKATPARPAAAKPASAKTTAAKTVEGKAGASEPAETKAVGRKTLSAKTVAPKAPEAKTVAPIPEAKAAAPKVTKTTPEGSGEASGEPAAKKPAAPKDPVAEVPAATAAVSAPAAAVRPMAKPAAGAPRDGAPQRQEGPRPSAPEAPRPSTTQPEGVRPEGPRPEGARSEVPRPGVRKLPPRPRGRGPRLEDMPTVVGPGVPLRKGVKPSGNVLSKEELARIQAEKAAQAEAARKAAAAAPPPRPAAPDSGEAPARGPAPRPAPPGAGRPRPSSPAKDAGERRDRAPRTASIPIPDIWAEAAEATGLVSPTRPAASRVRRGDDKPAKRRVIIDSQAGRKGGRGGLRDRRGIAVGEAEKPAPKKKALPGTESPVKVRSGASVKDLGDALELSAGELIKTLLKLGEMVTITQSLSDDAIVILAEEFERQVEIEHAEEEKEGPEVFVDDPADLVPRAPVVTIMGHVDHGKTSLLDAIRETEVVKSEAGGITQHIGAYQVTHNDKKVTFLDTPGHEAFTAMRARGAKSTDIAVIVVAANDGVMPQTLEAISHAKAAEVPIVVAINKMDLADANPDRVKAQLSEEGLVPESYGGDTVMVEVSAKQRLHLEELMDMILLVAEVQELKANSKTSASGVVIEAQLDVGRGPVATVLVQRGTLSVGDALVSGEAYGKVKAMFDFMGHAITKAGPSVPAQILGFNTLPSAGDFVTVAKDEREARQRAEQRTARLRQEQLAKSRGGASSLDEFYRRIKEGRVKELPLVVKGDVGGSVEALEEALRGITHPEVKVEIVFAGVGGINESDILLASASKAVVIGFNVRPSAAAKTLADQEQVDVRTYRVIYKAIEDVEAALVGMLEPEEVEEELGTAEVRQVFHASRIGTIAGCYVQSGKIVRSARIRLVRNGSIIHEGTIDSLKRFADDAREVSAGYECGLHLDGYDDVHEGDIIEAYEIKEVARTQ
ncbi:MAG: translation initiation factor IF-2 [Thermoleophilia bacterium]|nr:translation initiation factor IF-2 [Thermoleophilia bacterium]